MPRIAAPQTIPKRTQPNAPLKGTRVIGGVGACDEEENGVVIHYPEKLFGFRIGDSVIKG